MNPSDLERDLKEIVGERVTANPFELQFYTKEIVHIPEAVRAMLKTAPAAIVKPESAEQVAAVVAFCRERELPVIPRGAGTAGLFGSVPKKGGVVMDLMDLKTVIEVNPGQKTATAGAGATWWQLEKELNRRGLTLMTYPSSARSATLGGWVMTSGKGIGTLKYGEVGHQVLSAQFVFPDGGIGEYIAGNGLETFLKTEGLLCIMTRLTLRVRPIPEATGHRLVYFERIEDLFRAVDSLAGASPRPFNMEIFDHRYLELLKASGYETAPFGPGSGQMLVTYDGTPDEVEAGGRLVGEALGRHGGMEREGAGQEWGQRFNTFRIRRAVPTLLPSSVVLSLKRLEPFYRRLEKLRKRPVGLVGHVISTEECNLMPLIATDELRFLEYVFAMHTPSEVSRLALSLGGRPGGAIGVWNAGYRAQILGEEKIEEVRKKKTELDPAGILNPGMWFDPPVIFRPGIYQFLMGLAAIADKVLPAGKLETRQEGWEKEIAACVQCGYCMNECPTKGIWLSSTPRGRILMAKDLYISGTAKAGTISDDYKKRVLQCSLCGRCRIDCSVDIQSPEMWLGLRKQLARTGYGIE
ncbi:MAG: FAD-binding protein, partial [Deltaproteobacteria bacterium]|nr:FAD-binding protein [Deltaproteobacteria bacterium]